MSEAPWYSYGDQLWQATQQTIYMVFWTFAIGGVLGVALGIFLYLTSPGSTFVNRLLDRRLRHAVIVVNQVVGFVVNVLRSLPFIVLLIAIIPLTRLVTGTTLGPTAALVPLTLSIFPFFGRVVANALDEIDRGRIDAVEAMGVSIPQLIFRVLLPEARSGLIAGSTLTLISIIGNTAVASIIGSGGLGDFAIKYGYQRYNDALMYATVAVLIVMVQFVQVGGDLWLRKRAHRR
ncbi:ABC transporter permease [Mycobacterium yunnanensis]|uniref:ABC transporter permease n=1 Tax=Mycobacterium yunnanensis TaxID=368477 RepID=A0A9X2Z7F2_9MYCO|nr:methionine ABC transporter permease [Mycobacterium yunnanensis]MCV7424064.1 ABC transporter permease [Mycobacterium yunnanensis]